MTGWGEIPEPELNLNKYLTFFGFSPVRQEKFLCVEWREGLLFIIDKVRRTRVNCSTSECSQIDTDETVPV